MNKILLAATLAAVCGTAAAVDPTVTIYDHKGNEKEVSPRDVAKEPAPIINPIVIVEPPRRVGCAKRGDYWDCERGK